MSSDKKQSALDRIASRIRQANPNLTHQQARKVLETHLERADRKKEK